MPTFYEVDSNERIKDTKRLEALKSHQNTVLNLDSFFDEDAIDYRALSEEGSIGICELKGKRPTQEDNVSYIEGMDPKIFAGLSPFEIAQRFFLSVKAVGREWDDTAKLAPGKIKGDGSTFNATLRKGDTLVTATLGDAMSYLAIYDKDGNVQGVRRLNQFYHSPGLPEEEARIKRAGGIVTRFGTPRVNGKLAVSRAIGDTSMRPYVIDAPTVEINSINAIAEEFGVTSGRFGFAKIITCCDGLTDPAKHNLPKPKASVESSDEAFLFDFLKARGPSSHDEAPHDLAYDLASHAIANGSNDNVSVIVQNVQDHAALQGVYDGHGGHEASLLLAQRFNAIFLDYLKMAPAKIDEALLKYAESAEPLEIINHLDDLKDQISSIVLDDAIAFERTSFDAPLSPHKKPLASPIQFTQPKSNEPSSSFFQRVGSFFTAVGLAFVAFVLFIVQLLASVKVNRHSTRHHKTQTGNVYEHDVVPANPHVTSVQSAAVTPTETIAIGELKSRQSIAPSAPATPAKNMRI